MNRDGRIMVLGGSGLVGSAIVRCLSRIARNGHDDVYAPDHDVLDLTDSAQTWASFEEAEPECVFMCAGKVGGIGANSAHPAAFIRENLAMALNVIHACHLAKVKRLIFMGSSCIYPRDCPQPIKEEYLGTGPLESTNSAYAMAKLAAVEMCDAYRKQHGLDSVVVMPCNLYGQGDNYDPETSHVLPALIRKLHEARRAGGMVELWGDGSALREFLHVDDHARACVMLMDHPSPPEIVNVGSGEEISIGELVKLVAAVTGTERIARWDGSKPNGTPRKLLDSTRMRAMGWAPRVSLAEGIVDTYAHFLREHRESLA
jgi:GDP-L-fucose synthase